ncbi:unnamed protein product [Closterium sp. NIES-54]
MPGSGGTHSGVGELVTPRVRQVAEAALGGVQAATLLTSAVSGSENVGAGASTSTSLTPSAPLTKLLRGGGLTTALLLLALTTTGATPLCNSATSSTTASAASATSSASATPAAATAAAASTAAAYTSTSTTTSTTTPTPSTASTTTSTAPATPTSAPAPLAPASASAPTRGRRSTDRLETTEVGRSSRSDRGQEGGGGTPLKDRVALGAARGTSRPPFIEGCSPSPLSPSFAYTAGANVFVTEDVGAASTSAKHRSSKGKGGRGGEGGSGGGGGGSRSGGGGSGRGGGGSGGGGGGGTGGGSGSSDGGDGGSVRSGGSGGCGTGGGRSGPRRGGPSGGQRQQHFHTEHRCFSRLDEAWRAEFGDDVERPRWAKLLRSGIAIFDLEYDAIISATYALSFGADGDCYRCVPPDPGIAAAALGASASGTPPGTARAKALHTFTLDSGASRSFFCDSTTPLLAPVPVILGDPSRGTVVACSSTVLLCPAVPSCSLSGLHLPSFSTNLVSTAALQDAMVTTTTPGGQRVSICTCTRTGCHLAKFTRWLGSSLYTLATEPSLVAASTQVRSLPPLPPSPAPPCIPCVEERQCAAPYSSSFPLTTAPLQTLDMDVWGPARVSGQGHKRYFLLVVDDYMRPSPDPRALRDTSTDKLSARAIPCVFLGFVPDAPGWQFYHPTSRRVLPSQDVTFDESVPFYRLFPYRSAPPPPLPLFLAPDSPQVDPLLPQGPAPSCVSQVDPLLGTAPVQEAVGSGAAPGAASGGATSGGAEGGGAGSEGAGSRGAEPEGGELGGAEPEGVERGGAESEGAESEGAAPWGATLSGAPGAGGAGDTGAEGAAVTAGAGGTGGTAATGPGGDAGAGGAGVGGAGAGGVGAAGVGVGGTGAGGTGAAGAGGAVDPGAGGAGGTVRPRPYFVPLLLQRSCCQSHCLLATSVTDPSFESAAASALVAELLDFAVACRLDYASALVAVSASCYVMLSFAFTSVYLPTYVRVLHAWCERV